MAGVKRPPKRAVSVPLRQSAAAPYARCTQTPSGPPNSAARVAPATESCTKPMTARRSRNASDVMTERIRVLRRLAADERIGIRYRLAAERELLRMRWAAERELLLPQVVAKLQDAATTARSRELRLVFVKA